MNINSSLTHFYVRNRYNVYLRKYCKTSIYFIIRYLNIGIYALE